MGSGKREWDRMTKFAPPPTKFGPRPAAQAKDQMHAGGGRLHTPPPTRFGPVPSLQPKAVVQRMEMAATKQVAPPNPGETFKNCIHYALARLVMANIPGSRGVRTIKDPATVSSDVMRAAVENPGQKITIRIAFNIGATKKSGTVTVRFLAIGLNDPIPFNSVMIAQMRGTPYSAIKAIRAQVAKAQTVLGTEGISAEEREAAEADIKYSDDAIADQKARKNEIGTMMDDAHYFFVTDKGPVGVPSTSNTDIFQVDLRYSKKGDAMKYEQHTQADGANPSIGRVLGYLHFVGYQDVVTK